MADYHSVLSRAVASLPENTAAGRRAIYDKARNALVRQLETIQPPLPPAEIAKQRLALEEAVRRIEGETARAALTLGRPTAPPRPDRAAAPATPPRSEPPRTEPPRSEPPRPEPARPEARTEPRVDTVAPATPRVETPRAEAPRAERPRPETPRPQDEIRREPGRVEPGFVAGAAPQDGTRQDGGRREPRLDARADAPHPDRPAGEREPRPANLGRPIEPPLGVPAGRPAGDEETRREPVLGGTGDLAEKPDGLPHARGPSIEPAVPPAAPDEAVDPAEDLFAPQPEREKGRKRRGLFGRAAKEAGDTAPAGDEEGRRGRKRRKPKPADDLSDSPFDENGEWVASSGEVEPRPAVRRRARRRSSPAPLIATIVVAVVIAGAVATAYVYRDAILAAVDTPAEPAATAEEEAPELAPKDTDRLPTVTSPATPPAGGAAPASPAGQTSPSSETAAPPASGEAPVAPAADGSRSVPTTRIVTPQEPDAAPAAEPSAGPGATPAVPPADGATAPTSPPATATAASGLIGPSRSILYEEGEVPGTKGAALKGTAKWEMVRESIGGGAPEPIVRASIEVPERSITTTIIMRRNRDEALPASHLIEVAFELPVNFPPGGITNLPGMIMKPTEASRGDALIGASARVSDGLFWIALSSSENDQKINLGLLRDRGWIDLPILYNNGRRAILTLEKGSEGAEAINAAIDAWAKEN